MNFLAFALAYSGLAGLCLAMDRHYRAAFGRVPTPQTAAGLRVVACAVLVASIFASAASQPGATGYVGWFGFLTAAGITLIFLLPYVPRMAVGLALGGPIAAGLAAALQQYVIANG